MKQDSLNATITGLIANVELAHDICLSGTITRISGFMLEAVGLRAPVGSICKVYIESTKRALLTEVIGFANETTYLMAYEEIQGIVPGQQISFVDDKFSVPVDFSLLGRVVNGLCEPIDNKGPLCTTAKYDRHTAAMNPIDRVRISKPIDVGVRAINALLTVGQGQRLGIFAGSGVGKSVLLGMITRFTEADVVIVGLIGERGREVKEFIEEAVGLENLKNTVIIASPVDTSPLMRVNGAAVATTIAEYFRDQGLNVLLIIDSLTRYAQALRQVYLTLGEMPSSKGFSPSVFSRISQLVERTGQGAKHQGAITAFYTVLVEGDDLGDPVADHARSILDGHIVLSRKLADAGHYPAIDISSSISRVMTAITTEEHIASALKFKQLFSTYQSNLDLIKMGMYQAGADPLVDESMHHIDKINHFLRQQMNESTHFEDNVNELAGLFE
ncbi:MAG: FliI/YscN family ATPase [Legionella sp.]|nr:FliI/YscN family ATPase [Legionella sp.]